MKTKQILCLLLALILTILCLAGCRKDKPDSTAEDSTNETAEASEDNEKLDDPEDDKKLDDSEIHATDEENAPSSDDEQETSDEIKVSDETMIITADGDELIEGGE